MNGNPRCCLQNNFGPITPHNLHLYMQQPTNSGAIENVCVVFGRGINMTNRFFKFVDDAVSAVVL